MRDTRHEVSSGGRYDDQVCLLAEAYVLDLVDGVKNLGGDRLTR